MTDKTLHVAMLLSKSYRHDHRVSKEASALVDAGHHVTVIEWSRHDTDAPAQESLNGVTIERVHDEGLLRWAPGTVAKNPVWWRRAAARVRDVHQKHPVDVVHAHDLDTLPAGVRATRQLQVPLVYDAHERFHEIIDTTHPKLVVRVAAAMERRLVPKASAIITASDHLADVYRGLARADAPVVTVWNCFGPPPQIETPTAPRFETFTITYIGILSRDRMFPELVHILGAMEDVRFVVAGKREGVHAEVEAAARDHAQVKYLGPVPFDEVLPRTEEGHAVLCLLDPANPQYRYALATKLFDAMTCGRPIVVTEDTELGAFVERHKVGLTCSYDADGVRGAVAELRDDPELCAWLGANGLRLAHERFHWSRQASQLQGVYARLAARYDRPEGRT